MADGIQTDSAGSGPHDPGMEARVAKLELIAETTAITLVRIEGRPDGMDGRIGQLEKQAERLNSRIDRIDGRLRGVEQKLAEISGKIDALAGSVVGKLPSWWQMPAVSGSTLALLVLLYPAVRYLYLQAHGLL